MFLSLKVNVTTKIPWILKASIVLLSLSLNQKIPQVIKHLWQEAMALGCWKEGWSALPCCEPSAVTTLHSQLRRKRPPKGGGSLFEESTTIRGPANRPRANSKANLDEPHSRFILKSKTTWRDVSSTPPKQNPRSPEESPHSTVSQEWNNGKWRGGTRIRRLGRWLFWGLTIVEHRVPTTILHIPYVLFDLILTLYPWGWNDHPHIVKETRGS